MVDRSPVPADPLGLVAAGFSSTRDGRLAAFGATRLAAVFFSTFVDSMDVLLAIAFTVSVHWAGNLLARMTARPLPFGQIRLKPVGQLLGPAERDAVAAVDLIR